MHCHLIVSRKDQANKKKLSPLTNHKTPKWSNKGGFDRVNLFQQAEQGFDRLFGYNRQLSESFEYSNTMKTVLFRNNLNYRIKILLAKRKKKYSNTVKKKTIFLVILITKKKIDTLTTSSTIVGVILFCLFSHWEMAIITMPHQQKNYRHRNARRKRKRNKTMIEYEELRTEIDRYLMERFKYRKPLVWLTVDKIIVIRRNSRVDLYLRIRKVESSFPPNCLIIARLGFSKERIGHGTHFIRFLTEIARKYGLTISALNVPTSKAVHLPIN